MGIAQVGVAATTSSPSSQSRPIFTLANTYDLSGNLSGVNFTSNVISDLVYDKNQAKLAFAVTDNTSTNALASWTLGSTSVTRFNLPVSVQNPNFKFLSTKNNWLYYSPGLSGNYGLYASTAGASSSWMNTWGSTSRGDMTTVGSNIYPHSNANDTAVIIHVTSYALSGFQLLNDSSGAVYTVSTTGSASITDGSGGSFPRQKLTEIRSGDESNIINGYSYRAGADLIDNSNDGTCGVLGIKFYDLRSTSYAQFQTAQPPQLSTYNRDGWIKSPAGRETCIENRWILNVGLYGDSLYDLSTAQFIPAPTLGGYGSSRLVYLSTTKKAYQYNRNNYKMYEYDVTFI